MSRTPLWAILMLWLGGVLIGFSLGVCTTRTATAAPPPPEQPHSDVFEVAGWPAPALQVLNPLSVKLRGGERLIRFRYEVMPGCADGNMRSTLRAAMDSSAFLGLNFQEVTAGQDLVIRASCGTSFVNVCGPAAIACLGRGFPYVDDIDASTQMAAFFDVSQISIWLHELLGHALSTWHEQYCLGTEPFGNPCAGRSQFSAAPSFVSFMNTGPDSRHVWPQYDRDRWERSMYALAPVDCSGPTDVYGNVWDSCLQRWVSPFTGWLYDPATGIWELPDGTPEWSACSPFGHRWNFYKAVWMEAGHGLFAPERGFWSWAPPC